MLSLNCNSPHKRAYGVLLSTPNFRNRWRQFEGFGAAELGIISLASVPTITRIILSSSVFLPIFFCLVQIKFDFTSELTRAAHGRKVERRTEWGRMRGGTREAGLRGSSSSSSPLCRGVYLYINGKKCIYMYTPIHMYTYIWLVQYSVRSIWDRRKANFVSFYGYLLVRCIIERAKPPPSPPASLH